MKENVLTARFIDCAKLPLEMKEAQYFEMQNLHEHEAKRLCIQTIPV